MLVCVVRFCLSETSCLQEDNFPNSLCIKVNGKLFPLPVSVFSHQDSSASVSHCKDAHKASPSCRVMHHHQKMAWNRRDQDDLWTLLRWSDSPLRCPIRFQWRGRLKLEKWEQTENIIITLYSLLCFFFFLCAWTCSLACGQKQWLLGSGCSVIFSFRPIPCLCTWWGSWRHHCSCRGWGWRASETRTTPEH